MESEKEACTLEVTIYFAANRTDERGAGRQIAPGPRPLRALITPNTSRSGGLIKQSSSNFPKLISRL